MVLSATVWVAPVDAACPGWSIAPSPNVTGRHNALVGVTAATGNDVWAVGASGLDGTPPRTLVEHWNGTSWRVVSSPNPGTEASLLRAVDATASNDVWAVGVYASAGQERTFTAHWDGRAWKTTTSPNIGKYHNELNAVTAISATDVWAVGSYYSATTSTYQPLALHWNGLSWRTVSVPAPVPSYVASLGGIGAVSSKEVWAVGAYQGSGSYKTLTERWDGTRWRIVPSPNVTVLGTTSGVLGAIAIGSAANIWAVGEYDAGGRSATLALRWTGTAWSRATSANPAAVGDNELLGVAADSAGLAWAVGAKSDAPSRTLIERRSGSTWLGVTSPNATGWDNTLGGVASYGGNAWAVGSAYDGKWVHTLIVRGC